MDEHSHLVVIIEWLKVQLLSSLVILWLMKLEWFLK